MLENILCKEATRQKLKLKVYIIYELMRTQEREKKKILELNAIFEDFGLDHF